MEHGCLSTSPGSIRHTMTLAGVRALWLVAFTFAGTSAVEHVVRVQLFKDGVHEYVGLPFDELSLEADAKRWVHFMMNESRGPMSVDVHVASLAAEMRGIVARSRARWTRRIPVEIDGATEQLEFDPADEIRSVRSQSASTFNCDSGLGLSRRSIPPQDPRNIADLFVARRLGKRPCRAGGASACRLADALTVERGKASAQSQERAASRVTACVVSTLADDYAQAPLNFMHWLYSHAYPVVVGLWDLLGADFEWRDLNVLFEVSERSETVFLSECHAA